MNLSIYIRLLIANIFKKVKIKDSYRHIDFLIEKKWLLRLPNGSYTKIYNYDIPNFSDYYILTTEGKSQMFTFGTNVITWGISIVALILSLFPYLSSN